MPSSSNRWDASVVVPTPSNVPDESVPASRMGLGTSSLDASYRAGIEDLANKIIGLIYQSDFTVSLDDILAFLDAELGSSPKLHADGRFSWQAR